MKYTELDFKKIDKNKCNIKRYDNEIVVSKKCKIQFAPNQIKEIEFGGNVYKRDGEEVNIPWLSNNLHSSSYFYDETSQHEIMLIEFEDENGNVQYGFTDHDD